MGISRVEPESRYCTKTDETASDNSEISHQSNPGDKSTNVKYSGRQEQTRSRQRQKHKKIRMGSGTVRFDTEKSVQKKPGRSGMSAKQSGKERVPGRGFKYLGKK